MTVDVVIPVYKPDNKFLELMERLNSQTLRPERIIIINTERLFFERLIGEEEFRGRYDNSVIIHISEREFDHGGSRNLGASLSRADSMVFMTQDAVPADEYLLEHLLETLTDGQTAAAYAAQRPAGSDDVLEEFTRSFNYGEEPLCKKAEDVAHMGIKAYFCSNVCAIYQSEIFHRLGGFAPKIIFNEDMVYAAAALRAGFAVRYTPAARVFHSHHYNSKQLFRRNFDIGVSQTDHPEVFRGISSESEGIRMIGRACAYLLKCGKPWLIARLFIQSLAKYLGYSLGKRYRKLSRKQIMKYTMNKNYWP